MGGGRFESADGGDDAVTIRTGQDVPAGCDGFDPFCFVSQGDAGDPEPVGLFLHAAGIGEEEARGFFEGDDVEIADGIDEAHVGWRQIVFFVHKFARPGMRGKDDGFIERRKGRQDVCQALGVIRVFGAMDGGQEVALRLEPQAGQDVRLGRRLCGCKLQGIGHDIAGDDDSL